MLTTGLPPPLLLRTLAQGPGIAAPNPVKSELRLLSHRISAGFPSPAADYADEGLDLNTYLVRNKPATFMFTVRGDSVIGAGIFDGDIVVVDRSMRAKHKDIVVAVVGHPDSQQGLMSYPLPDEPSRNFCFRPAGPKWSQYESQQNPHPRNR